MRSLAVNLLIRADYPVVGWEILVTAAGRVAEEFFVLADFVGEGLQGEVLVGELRGHLKAAEAIVDLPQHPAALLATKISRLPLPGLCLPY
jgi:hypothetical protein